MQMGCRHLPSFINMHSFTSKTSLIKLVCVPDSESGVGLKAFSLEHSPKKVRSLNTCIF